MSHHQQANCQKHQRLVGLNVVQRQKSETPSIKRICDHIGSQNKDDVLCQIQQNDGNAFACAQKAQMPNNRAVAKPTDA